jgi:hypothetical protein
MCVCAYIHIIYNIYLYIIYMMYYIVYIVHIVCLYVPYFVHWLFTLDKISKYLRTFFLTLLLWYTFPLCEGTTVYFNQYLLIFTWLVLNFCYYNQQCIYYFYVCRYVFRGNSQNRITRLKNKAVIILINIVKLPSREIYHFVPLSVISENSYFSHILGQQSLPSNLWIFANLIYFSVVLNIIYLMRKVYNLFTCSRPSAFSSKKSSFWWNYLDLVSITLYCWTV